MSTEGKSPKDSLLEHMLSSRGLAGETYISKQVNLPKEVVLSLINEINKEKPRYLTIKPGYGDDHIWACVSSQAEAEVKLFLTNGGFTEEEKNNQKHARLEKEKASKEYE